VEKISDFLFSSGKSGPPKERKANDGARRQGRGNSSTTNDKKTAKESQGRKGKKPRSRLLLARGQREKKSREHATRNKTEVSEEGTK